jgi:hypothetical protein
MEAKGFTVPIGTSVTSDEGRYNTTSEITYLVTGRETTDVARLIALYVGVRFGPFNNGDVPNNHATGVDEFRTEILAAQKLTGSIEILGAIEARDVNGFKWLRVTAREQDRVRVYFDSVATGVEIEPAVHRNRAETIAEGLISQF